MFTVSQRQARTTTGLRERRPRRGVALVFVMVFVIAMAALAMSSIYMSSGSTMLARTYDRERDLRFAAEVALAIGKARVNTNPGLVVLPAGVNFKQIMASEPLIGADNKPIPGIVGNVYAGLTGSSSGQNGRFVSIVAQAIDSVTGVSYIRRLEMTQESFAKYAYWSNTESNNGTTIFFNNGDQLWGPVWSNDPINIGSGGATFNDAVGSASVINGKEYGTFIVPPLEKQTRIELPSTAVLGTLASYASLGNLVVNSADASAVDENQVRDRIEFIAFDTEHLGAAGDSSGDDKGFYRWYQGNAGSERAVRGDWTGGVDNNGNPTIPLASAVDLCGDWHYMPRGPGPQNVADTALKFYPASVHGQTWFRNQIQAGTAERMAGALPPGFTSYLAYANAEMALGVNANQPGGLAQILSHPHARCYPAGDPHLVATDRINLQGNLIGSYTTADVQRGGEDSTFTPSGRYGHWMTATTTPAPTISSLRPWDARYLYPLGHSFNPNGKGVIYASGNIGISGVVNGLVTLYTPGTIVLLDDVRYANDPARGVCHDILGLISGMNVVVADNAMNTPVTLKDGNGNVFYQSVDDSPGLFVHAVVMSLGTSFRVQNYDSGPRSGMTCGTAMNGRGCIDLSGGLIQVSRGPVGVTYALTNGGVASATGFAKRYTYDRCAVRNPPPYFPTTGRFTDNRYLELDPVGFKPDTYFKTLVPTSP